MLVASPDRLARHYAYQVLVMEELQRTGCEVVFLNHAFGEAPEERMLLQIQGVFAEHDRWLTSYNTQRHWAHENKKDGRRSPSEVLGPLTLLRHHPGDLSRAFFSTRFVRTLDQLGYARLKHWCIYGRRSLFHAGSNTI